MMPKRAKSAWVTAATSLMAAVTFAQPPFALDTTFRTVILDQNVNALLEQQDGKILLSGNIRFPGDISVRAGSRLNHDGTRDSSFPNVVFMGGKLVPWNNRVYSGNGQIVRRNMLDGTLDPEYIMMNNSPYFTSLQGGDYHVFADGRVLMSGAHTLSDTVRGYTGIHHLVWFSNQGYLDTTRVHRKGNGTLWYFKELHDGSFAFYCGCTQFDGVAVDRFFRTDSQGVPDTTFRTGTYWANGRDFLPLPDGRLYIAGRYLTSQMPGDTLRIARFLPDGSLDSGFAPPQFALGNLPNTGGLGPLVVSVRHWGQGQLLVTGRFQFVNGMPRRGICVMDTTGVITDDFDDCGVGPFVFMGLTNAGIYGLMANADSTHYYIWGSYNGYDDGTTNDPLQRFVTRLHVGDFTTGSSISAPKQAFMLYPNPSSGSATLQLEQVPPHAQLVLRDALGREVQRQRVSGHYTTITAARSGVYVVELWSQGERMSTQRLVVE